MIPVAIFAMLIFIGAMSDKGEVNKPVNGSMTSLLSEQCDTLSAIGYNSAKARDSGYKLGEVLTPLRKSRAGLDSDVEQAVRLAYSHKDWEPSQVAIVSRQTCINEHTGER